MRALRQLHRVALAVGEADGLDVSVALERPGQADRRILPAGEQQQGANFQASATASSSTAKLSPATPSPRATLEAGPRPRSPSAGSRAPVPERRFAGVGPERQCLKSQACQHRCARAGRDLPPGRAPRDRARTRSGSFPQAAASAATRARAGEIRHDRHRRHHRPRDPRQPRQPDGRGRRRAGGRRHGPRGGAVGRLDRARTRPSSCATATRSATSARACSRRSTPSTARSSMRSPAWMPRTSARIDAALIELDGTPNKSRLGANAILGVSLAVGQGRGGSAAGCRSTATSAAPTRTCCRCR